MIWISILIRRDNREPLSPPLAMLKTQGEGSHLQSRKRVLTRNFISQNLYLGLSSLQNCDKINVYCLSHPVYGILLEQPEQTKTTPKVMILVLNSLQQTWQLRGHYPLVFKLLNSSTDFLLQHFKDLLVSSRDNHTC